MATESVTPCTCNPIPGRGPCRGDENLNLALEHQNEMALVISARYEFETFFPADQLDTYIWLHVPSSHSADSALKMTCAGIFFPTSWLLPFSSAALRSSGFAKFAQLLDSPGYQKRTYRRMTESGVIPLNDPLRVKRYHLDLGPSEDSELRAEHLEALTLPRGIIRYSAMAGCGSDCVPMACAGGHDDACRCFQLRLAKAAEDKEDVKDVGDGQATTQAGEHAAPTPVQKPQSIWDRPLEPALQISDYCEIRHICNVIRLLMAVAGRRLVLSSAARVYTLAGLAKVFALTSSDGFYDGESEAYVDSATVANQFRSVFAAWFFDPQNAVIVDVLPEECFVVACNLKLAPVARAAFRIVVAERALLETANDGNEPRKPQARRTTPFGRELSGLLDDDVETMVEHASDSLIQRVLRFRDGIKAQRAGTAASSLHNLAKHPLFHEAHDGVLAQLVKVSEALEEFAAEEKTMLSSCPCLSPAGAAAEPIQSAYEAVQALLCYLVDVVAKAHWQASSPEACIDLLTAGPAKQCISRYRRNRPEDDAEWLAHTYETLSDDQRCMTAVYWKALADGTAKRLGQYAKRAAYVELLGTVDNRIRILAAAAAAAAPGIMSAWKGRATDATDAPLRELQKNLLLRLRGIGGLVPERTALLFNWPAVKDALHALVSEPLLPFYERAFYYPRFELEMLVPLPHLMVALTLDELRFLPLWAGGTNDGTGAVFQTVLPSAQLGPAGPGPAYHTGRTAAALSVAGPPSVSSGSIEEFVHLRLSDTSPEPVDSVAAEDLSELGLTGGGRASTTGSEQQAQVGISTVASELSANASSSPSLAAPSDAASSFVIVGDAAPPAAPHDLTARSLANGSGDDGDMYEFDDGEFDDDDDCDDDADNMQEFIDDDDDDDDDDDARSDNTVMPDREAIVEAMRQDSARA